MDKRSSIVAIVISVAIGFLWCIGVYGIACEFTRHEVGNITADFNTEPQIIADLPVISGNVLDMSYSENLPNLPDFSTNYVDLTGDEIYELATLVYLECGIESFECQQAVASVVINRMTTGGKTLSDVIYEPNQFSPAPLIPKSKPSESTLKAVMTVVECGPTIPEYVTFFRADHYHDWGNRYESFMCIDNTYFSYDKILKAKLIG